MGGPEPPGELGESCRAVYGWGGRERRRGQRQESGKEGLLGSVKKVITQDVLYLMIAEMPSPEEQERLLRGGRQ